MAIKFERNASTNNWFVCLLYGRYADDLDGAAGRIHKPEGIWIYEHWDYYLDSDALDAISAKLKELNQQGEG